MSLKRKVFGYYYRQPESVLREPWDNDIVATLTRLQAYLNMVSEDHGYDRPGQAYIGWSSLFQITHKFRLTAANSLLKRACEAVGATFEESDKGATIDWPDFAERVGGYIDDARIRQLRLEIAALRSEIVSILEARYGPRCQSCGAEGPPYHVDHKVPLIAGGLNELANLQLLCPRCNLEKGARH